MKRWIAFSLCMAMLAGATGCSPSYAAGTKNLTEGISPALSHDGTLTPEEASALTNAAVKLLQGSKSEENLLLSPLSALCALGMAAEGADGETREQLEALFGMDTDTLSRCMQAWLCSTGDGVCAADSLWVKQNGVKVEQNYLQTAANLYGADVFQSAFDGDALEALNAWVSQKTDGMIPEMLDELPEDAVMYLINALCFRCKWETEYNSSQVSDGTFTTEAGLAQDAEMMSSKESVYLEDDTATGFLKNYAGGRYAFAALLPKEGQTLSDFIAALDGARLTALLEGQSSETVNVTLPKFEIRYETELSDLLKGLGITDAFDETKADFSHICETNNLYVSRILHKTYIKVNETGTDAAASTAVELILKSARPIRTKSVILDRPFVYLIVDLETNIPLFMGTVTDLG